MSKLLRDEGPLLAILTLTQAGFEVRDSLPPPRDHPRRAAFDQAIAVIRERYWQVTDANTQKAAWREWTTQMGGPAHEQATRQTEAWALHHWNAAKESIAFDAAREVDDDASL